MLIVLCAFSLPLFTRPGVLLVVDGRYREAYGPARAARALGWARLSLRRPVEELVLDDTARPDMIAALVASRPEPPALVAFGSWLASYAEALQDSPGAPPLVILGGDSPHPFIPTLTVDRNRAYTALADRCAPLLEAAPGPLLLVADPPRAEALLALFRERPAFSSQAERVVLFDASTGFANSATAPAAVILAGARLASWPDEWNRVPLAFETLLPARYLPDGLFALIDASIYRALPFVNRFEGSAEALSYPARLVKPH